MVGEGFDRNVTHFMRAGGSQKTLGDRKDEREELVLHQGVLYSVVMTKHEVAVIDTKDDKYHLFLTVLGFENQRQEMHFLYFLNGNYLYPGAALKAK